MAHLLLLAAILAEVVGTIAVRFSDGFSKPVPSVVAALGVVGAYFLLSRVLKQGMGVGVAYGIWAALGVSLIAIIGIFLGDGLTWIQGAGVVLVIGGVLALELGAAH
ncbi:DMT family transporter [Amycolatopsis cihanbeyliensis]|uniref:Small multidrug resistance pump n=1 Tax=Amycolatopsis cihanbeyliensis TaxID=1128664 RepID=A0A542DML2_AMYCI|nr:SMR family transporter [Amycolatopsis cihanbeyliensis]TQJ04327.1 small multidrug resistance pump [Amycolatopsis cihanbeyliensis]